MKGKPLSITKIRHRGDLLKVETAELKAELIEAGHIEPPRNVRFLRSMGAPGQITADEQSAIDAYLAKHEPRHFANSDSGDDFHIFALLRSHGHKVHRTCPEGWRAYRYSLDDKVISRADFIAFVDKLRASIGKPPIGVAA